MTTQTMHTLWESSCLDGGSQAYLESQYDLFLKSPEQLSDEWKDYFQSMGAQSQGTQTAAEVSHQDIREMFCELAKKPIITQTSEVSLEHERKQTAVHDLINGYRLLGHLYAKINPLKKDEPPRVSELELAHYGLSEQDFALEFDAADLIGHQRRPLNHIFNDLRSIYCGSVASEFMHIPDSEERLWVQNAIEHKILRHNFTKEERFRILEMMTAAEGLEKYLGSKYPGAKRFGLEGCDSLIVALDQLVMGAGETGLQEIVIGMAHRGRLNVLVNIFGKMPRELFDEFEGKHSKEVESGDVKYHQGFASDIQINNSNYLHLSMAFNPSHLEIVSPVVCGSVRARQERRELEERNTVLSVALHGDAAFAGQGVVMETLNMSLTRGYKIGGTIHIITNNQVGFTTSNPKDARSTLYCSDLGKMILAPIFHVNADEPESVAAVMQVALEYRNHFGKDVIIDLVGYRRLGHNEADEPSATQPKMYQFIKKHPTARKLYGESLIKNNIFTKREVEAIEQQYRSSLDARDKSVAKHSMEHDWKSSFASDWTQYGAGDWRVPTKTSLPEQTLKKLATARDTVPASFKLNARVEKIVSDRQKMTAGEQLVDWGYAETLAYASIVNEGYGVRLSGQDCGRGTFFHRHAVWHDQNTGEAYTSLCHIKPEQGQFCVIDSLLSEAAVLGFEYGFSTSEPRTLCIWEAQFGDFANGAQVVIDQFISSGEQKWGRLSGLVMLLPHGYEGQGPEHSSARLERYLQLCAQHNIQVCIPSTPAQVFHMLRRQLLRPLRKPLIVMSPKSLLRHKGAVSSLQELSSGSFQPILSDSGYAESNAKRVVLCSGKVYYELDEYRKTQKNKSVAVIRVEQLYPFPEKELVEVLKTYKEAQEIVWCQEEPQNQGTWYSSQHHFRNCLQSGQSLRYAGREPSAAPAVGYMHLHQEQQTQLLSDAID